MGLRHLRYLVAVADAGVTPSDFKLESASDRRIRAVSRRNGGQRYASQCTAVSTNPAATSREHSSRSCIARRRSARRLTSAVATGGTPISINLMRGLE